MDLCHQCGAGLTEGDRFCRNCGASTTSEDGGSGDPMVGRTVGGNYVIQDLVGVGGMGRVYRAEQKMLGRAVAVKVVHPHLLADEQSVARFYTEARAASRLNHPNSVSIIDFGRTDDGVLYLVMEYLNGKDLSRLAHEEGPLPFPRICGIMDGMLGALGEAHALEVVHRDLKPENVIVEPMRSGEDLIKVVDFGLAKLLGGGGGAAATKITMPGLVCGTPDYMSPEQGRGLDVDGRGDLYAAGVVLFELLTGQLPFPADTPTNVVLRHIQDPIPDPLEIAPQRGIPHALAELTVRALSKDRDERFQTAADMALAIREAERQLTPGVAQSRCAQCGHLNPAAARFCADCGNSMMTSTAKLSTRPERAPMVSSRGVLVGREQEFELLDRLRRDAREQLCAVQLLGEAGIGKTRLLAEMADRAKNAGDLVVAAGPHPTVAPVPLHGIRMLVEGMLETDAEGLGQLAAELAPEDPAVAAGLRELCEPSGITGADGKSRAGAVAAAFAYAAQEAGQGGSRGVLVTVDDLHLCDGLTRETLERLPTLHPQLPLLLVAAGPSRRDALVSRDAVQLELRGLTYSEASALIEGEQPASQREPDPDDDLLLPLYVEIIKDLGVGLDDPQRPRRLADAVMQSLQRLPVGAAHMMQAICIAGMRCELPMLEALGIAPDPSALDVLRSRGLVKVQGWNAEVAHPFVRDLVEASVPAEARKQLHAKALVAVKASDAPLEVLAHHAYGSGEVLGALVLLERMGDQAHARGDLRTAVLGYQRALELARRELLVSGDAYLEGAIETLSSRLGGALAKRGDIAGAEGVLREAMEYSAPNSVQRAHIQIALASVLVEKKRVREAYRLLGQALEVGIEHDSEPVQVDVQIAVARLRRSEANYTGAAAALSVAHNLLGDAPDRLKAAIVALELARVRVDAGDDGAARLALADADVAADEADAPYLGAQVAALEGRLAAASGDDSRSREGYGEAARQASIAGDVEMAQRFGRLARGSGPPRDPAVP